MVKRYLEGPGEGPHLHSPTPAVDSDAGEAGIIRAAVSFRRADVEGGAAKAALEIRTRGRTVSEPERPAGFQPKEFTHG